MKRSGFTLIELMVVVVVISLLAVAVFRMVAAVGKGNDKAETRARLEKVGHALEEFKAQYGKYPPVPSYGKNQPMGYEFPTLDCVAWGDVDKEAKAKQFLRYEQEGGEIHWGSGPNCGVFYTFGLVSFFLPRYNRTADQGPKTLAGVTGGSQSSGGALKQWRKWNTKVSGKIGDSERDLNACRKILPYLDGGIDAYGKIDYGIIHQGQSSARPLNCDYVSTIVVTNCYYTILDAWERELQYVSRPPYESYVLRSAGPDGEFGTDDDLVAGQE